MDKESEKAWSEYVDRFDEVPNFTTVRLSGDNNSHFLAAIKGALENDVPLTEEEWEAVDYKTFGDLYMDDGVKTSR